MTAGKPDNTPRKILRGIGVALFHLGLAPLVINLHTKRIRALLYHAVEAEKNPLTDGLNVSVTPKVFAANLDYFKRYYNVVSMHEVVSGSLPPKPLVITFDDGYMSVFTHAAPALRERELTASVYLITRAVEGRVVWVNLLNYALHKHKDQTLELLSGFAKLDSLVVNAEIISTVQHSFTPSEIDELCKTLQQELPPVDVSDLYAGEAEIQAMQKNGLEFGFHTVDHYNLRNCTEQELNVQLDASGCSHLTNSNTFAYPFGYFNSKAVSYLDGKNFDRVMTVGNNNDKFSIKHLDRTEVFSANHAELFSQIEIVEPIIAWLRRRIVKADANDTKDLVRSDELA